MPVAAVGEQSGGKLEGMLVAGVVRRAVRRSGAEGSGLLLHKPKQ